MCGKNHCQFVFLRSGKNQTCVAFIKHIPNTNVCGKSHTCLLKDKHVCNFPYKRWYFLYLQLYFVFFKRIYYIISPSFISEVTMQCQKSETSSNQPWKKSPVWEFPHMCGKTHTHKKQKQQKQHQTKSILHVGTTSIRGFLISILKMFLF